MTKLDENVTREMNKYLEGTTIEEIMMNHSKMFHFKVNLSRRQMEQDIDVLDLNQRAYNCLKRAGYSTIGSLINGIYTKDGETSKRQLLRIRNLGKNSADEIMIQLMNYHFMNLPEGKKQAYMNNILEINFGM